MKEDNGNKQNRSAQLREIWFCWGLTGASVAATWERLFGGATGGEALQGPLGRAQGAGRRKGRKRGAGTPEDGLKLEETQAP